MSSYTAPIVAVNGLVVPTYQEILANLIANFQAIFGTAAYLGTSSPDYQLLAILALAVSDLNQSLVAVWLQFSPQTATGVSLDLLGKLIGTARKTATNSTVTLTITGTPGTVINGGIAQDTQGNNWLLPNPVTIPSGGSLSVTATAQYAGAVSANAGTITIIFTPTAGWTGVTNPGNAVVGEPVEPDSQYRARLVISQSKPSLSLIAGTAAAVAAVLNVTRSVVYENQYGVTTSFGLCNTSGTGFTILNGYPLDSSDVGQTMTINGTGYTIATVNSGGMTGTLGSSAGTLTSATYYVGPAPGISLGPAHSITCIVENGASSDIAQAIYANKNPGVLTNGTTTVTVIDPLNGDISIPISFDVLSYEQIYVYVSILPLTGYTSAIGSAIQTALFNYLDALGIGESVIYSQLYAIAAGANPNPYQPVFSIRSISAGPLTAQTTANTQSGSANLPLTSATGVVAGQAVVGSGIPIGATVSSIGLAETLTLDAAGTGYTNASGLSTTGGSGTGLTVTITTSSGGIVSATVSAAGTGYAVGDIVTVVQGGASGGQLNITVTGVLLSANATATASAVPVEFFTIGTSDIEVPYNKAAQGETAYVQLNVI